MGISVAITCAACRDRVAPFAPPQHDFGAQLTYGMGSDIANTNSSRTPAVSPDGSRLGFARAKPQLEVEYDIWVIAL